MKHLSIKAKITLWYTVLMALLVIVMLWILFSVSNTRILSGANTRLKNTVVRSFREIDFEDGMLEFDDDFLRHIPVGIRPLRQLSVWPAPGLLLGNAYSGHGRIAAGL